MLDIFDPTLNQLSLSNKYNEGAVFLVPEVAQKMSKEICKESLI